MRRFVSKLAYKLNDFIAYKNALGIKYDTSRVYLLELDQYNLEHGNYALLTKELAEGWALWHAGKSESQDRSWIPPIREFGRYLRSIGESDAYVLDDRFSIQHYHAEVYLMTNEEIQAFFKACDSYVLRIKLSEGHTCFLHYTGSSIVVVYAAAKPESLNAAMSTWTMGLLIYSIPNLTGTADFIFQRNSSLISGSMTMQSQSAFPKENIFFLEVMEVSARPAHYHRTSVTYGSQPG